MKIKALSFLIVLAIGLASCTHVSSSSMTMLGSDADEVTYQTGGSVAGGKPTVAFRAVKLNNSASFGKVTELGGSLITWWGIGQIAKAAGKTYDTYNQEKTLQNADKLKAATASEQIKATTAIELAKEVPPVVP